MQRTHVCLYGLMVKRITSNVMIRFQVRFLVEATLYFLFFISFLLLSLYNVSERHKFPVENSACCGSGFPLEGT